MRSAEDYYNEYANMEGGNKSDFIEVLNKARREAISESAKNAEMYVDSSKSPYGSEVRESILQLLNQIQ